MVYLLTFLPIRVVPLFLLIGGIAIRSLIAAPPDQSVSFANHSKHWSRQNDAMILTDLSLAQPTDAMTNGKRAKGKWKVIPYETANLKGTALSTYSFTGAPVVSLTLPAAGWHAIYLGISTVSTGFREDHNGLKVKLSSEAVFMRMANNMALLPQRVDVIQDTFFSVANLNGQSLQIGSLPNLPGTLCYVKLIPLSESEVERWNEAKQQRDLTKRTSIATFDGHSWIWPYECETEEDLLANFRGFEESTIGKWWFQVLGADLVIYPSKVGKIPGDQTEDFPTRAHEAFVQSIKKLHAKGINPLRVARDEARRQGVEFHVMLRPAGWKAGIPFEETFDSQFYADHPEWRCVDRDGTPTMHMSFAYPKVRQHLIEVFRETLELQPDGVGLLFNRGLPLMLWEKPFCERFALMHKADAHEVTEDDPRIFATRAAIMTDFMQEIRTLLDSTDHQAVHAHRTKLSLATFSKKSDNEKYGLDLPRWIEQGLVDDLAIAWFTNHTSFADPDVAYYKSLVAGRNVGVYPFVVSWKPGSPAELSKKVTSYYQAGANGIAIWDPKIEGGWKDRPHGNIFDTLGRLSDRATVARWAKDGVPLPQTIPLTRLDENYYSRWFPTTGF
jgi:hypothetical protein